MRTSHEFFVSDSRSYSPNDIDLVVTSPPYPKIEMWDEIWDDDFQTAHDYLDEIWDSVYRALVSGGTFCVNIGDATRTDDDYQIWSNRYRLIDSLVDRFRLIGQIIWTKPSNSPTPFLGSGTAPPNQYVTLDHEHILIFRKGSNPESDPESSYFFWERNEWFSDLWDIRGDLQDTEGDRDVAASFPLEVPLRLVSMYSTRGDTVWDPCAGTCTTAVAAAVCGRDSLMTELDRSFRDVWENRLERVPQISDEWISSRIERHSRETTDPNYYNERLGLPVVTREESEMRLYRATDVSDHRVGYREVRDTDPLLNAQDTFEDF